MQYYKDSYLANNNYYLIGAPIQCQLDKYLPQSEKALLLQYLYVIKNPNPYNKKELYKMNRSHKTEYYECYFKRYNKRQEERQYLKTSLFMNLHITKK